ncbi:MAG: glycosyltransferase [Bacteroidota bacterium]|nr:glycosyltransferase [Bacteroidota bacterium]
MKCKTSLLIVIDNLKKGGAEILLTGILHDLNKIFEVTLVTLSAECDFIEEIECKKRYSLGFKSNFYLISSIWKLKKIIKNHRPSIIHSHLFYSSLIARLACPSSVPLVYSLHGEMSKNVFNNSKLLTFLEKKTIKKNHSVIAVSNAVLKDYEKTIAKNINSFVLKNYISNLFFCENKYEKDYNGLQKLKLIAVGNLKKTKNYAYLVSAFSYLKDYKVSLDVYGQGNRIDFEILRNEIEKNNLAIIFKGPVNNLHELLTDYDLYVSCSKHEGFGIASVEAMATGIPLLLSDLPVYHEITMENALFFDVSNPISFSDLIKSILEKKYDLNEISKNGIRISKKYTKEIYLKKLFNIYDSILQTAQ